MFWLINYCYILIFTLILVQMISLCDSLFNDVFAFSPSFPRQEIKDEPFDWRDMDKQNYTTMGDLVTDLRRVNYFSDGEVLNSTLWLSERTEKLWTNSHDISYGIFVDADSKKETGWQGVDYQMETTWQNGMWQSTLVEFSSLGDMRILNTKNSSGNFFESMGNFVLLSLDLHDIIFPERYKLIFYAGQIKEDENSTSRIMDFTNWVHIPPPEFLISTEPTSTDLRLGEQKVVTVRVNSTTGFKPLVYLSAVNQTDVEWKYKTDELHIPSYGLETTSLQIKASKNAESRPYVLNLLANATFPPEPLINPQSFAEQKITIPQENEYILGQSSLIINVLPPLTPEESIISFWNTYGSPMNFIYGIAAGLAPWFFSKIKNKLKKNNNAIR
jgi:hypothetical protein